MAGIGRLQARHNAARLILPLTHTRLFARWLSMVAFGLRVGHPKMCLCMYIHTSTNISIRVYTHVYTRARACVCTRIGTHVYTCLHVCTHVSTRVYTHVHTNVHTYVMDICACTSINMSAHTPSNFALVVLGLIVRSQIPGRPYPNHFLDSTQQQRMCILEYELVGQQP